eukprot:g19012.t2
MVLSWHPRREGLPEHLLGLFKHYTRFGRLRLDGRQLLGSEDDLALRRCRQRAFIQPPHRTLRRSWSAEDIWRLYLPKLDEPMGRNFARNLEFDEWQEWKWASEAEEQEEVEGDVLLLSDDRRAVAPRVPQPVDMAKQLGRDTVDHDDFEELVLSPKRPMRRTSCFVDMAKEPGRPEKLELDPHIWAEEHERVFCYKPTLGEETDEMLDLSPASVQRRLLPRTPTYDWALCLGRPGLTHPFVGLSSHQDGPILLTNWEAPFVAPATPRPPPLPPGEEVFLPSLHGLSVQEEPHVPEPPAPEPPEPPEPPAPPMAWTQHALAPRSPSLSLHSAPEHHALDVAMKEKDGLQELKEKIFLLLCVEAQRHFQELQAIPDAAVASRLSRSTHQAEELSQEMANELESHLHLCQALTRTKEEAGRLHQLCEKGLEELTKIQEESASYCFDSEDDHEAKRRAKAFEEEEAALSQLLEMAEAEEAEVQRLKSLMDFEEQLGLPRTEGSDFAPVAAFLAMRIELQDDVVTLGQRLDDPRFSVKVEWDTQGRLLLAEPHPSLHLRTEASRAVEQDDLGRLLVLVWDRASRRASQGELP